MVTNFVCNYPIIMVTEENNLPDEQPLQYCPGIRCKTGRQCIPTKRRCDKYVDCMNAEDEEQCDYAGSQYNVDVYQSRNTDRSNFKYSISKHVAENRANVANSTSTTVSSATTTFHRNDISSTRSPITGVAVSAITGRNKQTVTAVNTTENDINNTDVTKLNDTVLNAIKQLFDNQFTEKTFSCRRYCK